MIPYSASGIASAISGTSTPRSAIPGRKIRGRSWHSSQRAVVNCKDVVTFTRGLSFSRPGVVVHGAGADQSDSESVHHTQEDAGGADRGVSSGRPEAEESDSREASRATNGRSPAWGRTAEGAGITSSAAPARRRPLARARGRRGGNRVIALAFHRTLAVAVAKSGRDVR